MVRLLSLLVAALKKFGAELLTALGFSIVTYTGMNVVFDMLIQNLQTNISNLPSAMAQLFFLSGGGDAINIILSAGAFKLSMKAASKIKISGKGAAV